MKVLESSVGQSIGGGFLRVGLAPEPRVSGEGKPRVAPSQIPQASSRSWMYSAAVESPKDPFARWLR
jgi:hypothetical protein